MMRTLGTFGTLVALFVCVLLAADARAAEAAAGRGSRPVWGTVTKASADSITIAPEAPAARRNRNRAAKPPEKPPERTFALSKDDTEFMFAEVGAQRMMANGTTLRTLTAPEPATAADVKVGQLVEVTPGKDAPAAGAPAAGAAAEGGSDAAKRVVIAWGVPGTLVKVDAESITFRPAPADATAFFPRPTPRPAAPADDGDAAAKDEQDEQTLRIVKDATRVTIATVADVRPAENGRGVVQSVTYRAGALADLRPEQSVILFIKNDAAAKVTILESDTKP